MPETVLMKMSGLYYYVNQSTVWQFSRKYQTVVFQHERSVVMPRPRSTYPVTARKREGNVLIGVCAILFKVGRGCHVTIIHDAMDLTVQTPPPVHCFCEGPLHTLMRISVNCLLFPLQKYFLKLHNLFVFFCSHFSVITAVAVHTVYFVFCPFVFNYQFIVF